MHLSKYEIVLKVAETQSFTRTAEYFQYTQSAISQTVKSVEEELMVSLFRRIPGGVLLSEEGKYLLPFIQKIVTEQRHLAECVGDLQQLHSGIVRLGAYLSLSCYWIPPCIKEFQKHFPNIEFELCQEDDVTLVEMLKKGSLDLLFMSNPAKREFTYQSLFEDPFVVVVPENHFAAERSSIDLKELEDETYISLDVGYGPYLDRMFKDAGIKPLIKYRMIDDVSILSMVEQGLGISILPKFVTTRHSFQISLVPVSPCYTRNLGMVTRKNDYLSWSVKKFMEFAGNYVPPELEKAEHLCDCTELFLR